LARSTQLPANPLDAERAISARLLTAANRRVEHLDDSRERERARNEWVQRLRRELAYRRLLARLFTVQPESWVLKGGVALLFRLDPNRPSYDIDIAYSGAGVDHAVAITRLARAVASDLGDWFSFELGAPRAMKDEDHAITIGVIARIGAKEFARFSIDMPPPRGDVPSEPFAAPHIGIGFDALDDIPQMRLQPLEDQLADKICAMFERHDAHGRQLSSRSRDLADIAMVASQCCIDGTRLQEVLTAENKRREAARLPDGLPTEFTIGSEQQEQWRGTWTTSARKPPIGFDDALAIATTFLEPVFASEVGDLSWNPASQAWCIAAVPDQ
jgi:hypothetical protein